MIVFMGVSELKGGLFSEVRCIMRRNTALRRGCCAICSLPIPGCGDVFNYFAIVINSAPSTWRKMAAWPTVRNIESSSTIRTPASISKP